MVIVTQNQYILAQKIHSVTMDEQCSSIEVREGGRYKTKLDKYFEITVIYTPEQLNNPNAMHSRDPEMRECTVVMRGAINAHRVFMNLIQQIREQMPDQLFLDKALEQLMNDTGTGLLEQSDKEAKERELEMEQFHDRSAKKIRPVRKEKRRSKKILRRVKNRRR